MKRTDEITKEEIDAIKFYLGDQETADKGFYRGGNKAYITINALLNPGIRNELSKTRENKKIEIYDVEHLKSYLSIITLIYSAMCKYQCKVKNTLKKQNLSYRIERTSAVEECIYKGKHIYGNFSTCKNGFIPYYAHEKIDITLLEVIRDENLPFLDFAEVLGGDYSKPEEAEILVPTYSKINHVDFKELSEVEKELTDKNGDLPKCKNVVYLSKAEYPKLSGDEVQKLYDEITCVENVEYASKIMDKLSLHIKLSDDEIARYSNWKESLQKYIYAMFAKIESN